MEIFLIAIAFAAGMLAGLCAAGRPGGTESGPCPREAERIAEQAPQEQEQMRRAWENLLRYDGTEQDED